jgi:hypothetical protein
MFIKDTLKTPPQKKSTSEKYKNDKQWFKDCLDAYEYQALYYEQELHRKMHIHFKMDDGDIDQTEMEAVFNPMGLSDGTFPSAIKNYPISVPKIDLLVGEEAKRKFDFSARSKNPGSEGSSVTALVDMFLEIAIDEFKKEGLDEAQLEQRIREYARYAKYRFKDVNEITANKILKYLTRNYSLAYQFNKGMRNAFVAAREVYRIDIEGDEPVPVLCDPRNVFRIKYGDSERIEDSEAIVEITYEPINRIVDSFYDHLTPGEIDQLETGQWGANGKSKDVLGYKNSQPVIYSNLDFGDGPGFADIRDFNGTNFKLGLPYDTMGNVRVVRARWIGRKKIGVVTYFDENGDEAEKIVSEYYKVVPELGETVKWMWINEAYEGTKIADNIYIKLQPRPVQMRHYNNKSKCFLGYVGSDYGKSLMGRMEPYQYLYNIYMNKLEMLFAKYKGPIYELDISKVPDEWDMEMWMYYADVLGWAVIDPMNEGKKGAATGKLAGAFNTTGKVMDPKIGDYIQQTIGMLQHIENQMGTIAGVTQQRQGQIENRETVGGVERSVTQSSHITEKWFVLHDETRKRVLAALLDTAKYIWARRKSVKLSYIMDDMSIDFIEFNGEDFASTEQDIFISNSAKDAEIKEVIKQLAQPYIQNGLGSVMIDLLNTDSVVEMGLMLKEQEELMQQRQQQSAEQQAKAEEMKLERETQMKVAELEFKYKELEEKIALEYAKLEASINNAMNNAEPIKEKQVGILEKKVNEDSEVKRNQLNETIRHNQQVEQISRISKNAK